jgi:hypothetical protein
MLRTSNSVKAKWLVLLTSCLALALLPVQPEVASARMWKHSRAKGKSLKPTRITSDYAGIETANDVATLETESSPAISASTNPKLFWVECDTVTSMGEDETCVGKLWLVDPLEATPAAALYDSNVLVSDELENGVPWLDDYGVTTGTIDLNTYHMTDLKVGYVFYFKNGRIWLVDTTTLVKTQLSNETGVTSAQLCDAKALTDWQAPGNSTIIYHLKGTDDICWNDNDVWKAVKLNMTAAATPINFNTLNMYIDHLLFNGKTLVTDWSTWPPGKLKMCNQNLANCVQVDTVTNDTRTKAFDKDFLVLEVDGNLKRYGITTGVLKSLYAPAVGEELDDVVLDKDGTVYFSVIDITSPFSANAVKKAAVSPAGVVTVTTLATVANTAKSALPFLGITLAGDRVVYSYVNLAVSSPAETVVSIRKTGGAPTILTSTNVNGGVVGQYLYSEDTLGRLMKVKVDGTGKSIRNNALLVGATLGGSADWHYQFDTATFKGIVAGIDNKVRVVDYLEDMSVTAGIPVGTVPVNLNNFSVFNASADMVGFAGRRDTDISFGRDILLIRTGDANPLLQRLTNRSGRKMVFESDTD